MAPVKKEAIVEEVINNINAKYGIEQAITDDFRTMMMSALSSCYIYSTSASAVTSGGDTSAKPSKAGRKRAAAAEAAASAASDAETASTKDRKPRKTSSYNVYVKEMMQSDSVKSAPQKEKMTKIGLMWKALGPDAKAVYKQRAEAENAANPVLAAQE